MIRVLIVDDHPVVRAGLSRLLAREGIAVVGEAQTGEEGIALALELQPDVILWDLAMPGGGISGIPKLKAVAPEVRVMILTALDDPLLSREVMKAGADSFLAKTCHPDRLLAAVRACAQGKPHFPTFSPLSPREEELLALLSQGLTNREIAERLAVSVKTVENHIENLKAKLGLATTSELRALALRRAYTEEL